MKNRLRILYLIDSLATGGAERMAVRIANLMAGDHDVHLVVTRKEGPFKALISPQVHYAFLNKRFAAGWRAYWKLFRYIRKNKIQIIHAHSTSVFMALMMKWRLPRLKIVWHDHSGATIKKRSGYGLLRFMAARIDFLIGVNKSQLSETLQTLPIGQGEVLNNFAQLTDPNVQRENRMVLVANWRHEKNVVLALRAFEKIHRRFPDWKLDLVGRATDEITSREITSFIDEKHLNGQVKTHTDVNEVAPYLFGARIGILSSRWEGLPVALLEYGLAGLAVAATNVGGVGQLIRNGETGLLVPPGNADALAGAMERLITDTSLRKRLAENLRNEVERNYSARAYKSRLEEIYKSLAG